MCFTVSFSNARKLFRMLKWLAEYQLINKLLREQDTMPVHKLILGLIQRIALFWYWVFDTLIVLSKINFLKNTDIKWITHKWAGFWTTANFTGIVTAIVELVAISKEEVKLIASKRLAASTNAQVQLDSSAGGKILTLEEIKASKPQREIPLEENPLRN